MKSPTHKKALSRAALHLRQRELDDLEVQYNPDRDSYTVWEPWRYLFVTLNRDLSELRLSRRDILVTREAATAKRNALACVTVENGGEPVTLLGLWERGGERVITLRLPDDDGGFEKVFLREELTFVGVVVGYIRREWRRAERPPVHVYKGGA